MEAEESHRLLSASQSPRKLLKPRAPEVLTSEGRRQISQFKQREKLLPLLSLFALSELSTGWLIDADSHQSPAGGREAWGLGGGWEQRKAEVAVN